MPQAGDSKAVLEAAFQVFEAERLDIMQQLGPLQARLREVQGTQANLLKRISPDAPSHSTTPHRPLHQKYAKFGVRWAILDLLNNSPEGMSTSEIAEALTAGGIQTEAANFANNVSAVLSTTMKMSRKEVESLSDGKWKLTPIGVSAIHHIQSTEKFERACASWSV